MALTDDLDSLFSCVMLQEIKGYEISNFYSFSKLYIVEDYERNLDLELVGLVGIDLDLVEHEDYSPRCWGNHVTVDKNENSANLNVIKGIGSSNYYSKYCGSVLLQIISYYDIDISILSEEAMMVLLCVDSTYLMYDFNQANCKKWLVDILELPELYELCKKYSRKDFEALHQKYNLKSKIKMFNGELKTGLDLKGLSELFDLPFILPKFKFNETNTYIDKGLPLWKYKDFKVEVEANGGEIFSEALTSKDFIKFSYVL